MAMMNNPIILIVTLSAVLLIPLIKYRAIIISAAVIAMAISVPTIETIIPCSAVSVIAAVIAAGPAINGVATGTAARASIFFSLFIVTIPPPSRASNPILNNTNPPATLRASNSM
ncbi:114aa long hypothetical protein [Pyrococcus horikoshii OT3]|uniref:Uncharacterized protein n=1 Tax=Pyrococcus horikoshii (strain ATCC 700860 / DSM 12428 / JCM 9974 / NBRC 100139 / OT-3) TaxID=70601 RepID=O57954_PYRHO|nr:114aa long hypothetical protein [Pyrococcus horikoshii OT3]